MHIGGGDLSTVVAQQAHVDLCLVRACGSIVTRELGVKYGVVLSKQGLEIGPDCLRYDAVWVYLNGCRVTGIRGW